MNQQSFDFQISLPSIHVWHFEFYKILNYLPRVSLFLSASEKERANRYFHREDQARYRISHGLLRILIAAYLKRPPDQLIFDQNPYGKPFLSGDLKRNLFFNISHTKEELLIAVSPSCEVGVDVETIDKDDFPIMEIANRFFSPYEVTTLKNIAESLRMKAFFLCWTRKEAFIKAIGLGLSFPLNSFDVSLVPGESARLLRLESDNLTVGRYRLTNLEYGPNTAAALCWEGDLNISQFDGNVIDIPTNY